MPSQASDSGPSDFSSFNFVDDYGSGSIEKGTNYFPCDTKPKLMDTMMEAFNDFPPHPSLRLQRCLQTVVEA